MAKRPEFIRFENEILYLTEGLDPRISKEDRHVDPATLIDNISTDEITPGWVCFWYDETLGDYCLVGLRGGKIKKDDIKNSGAKIIVSGLSKGCGSSRETAPYSEKCAGIELVVAKTIEKIYGQNCRNIGLLTTTDFSILDKIERGEPIPLSEFTKGLNPIESGIVEHGGLFAYNLARLRGEVSPPAVDTIKRPMTMVEKIIAQQAVVNAKLGTIGIPQVAPGDALFCRADVRFSHEYVTPMADSLFRQGFGEEAKLNDPNSIYAFRDHLTFIDQVMPEVQKKKGLLLLAKDLARVQSLFVQKHKIHYYGESTAGGSEAICHNAVMEDIAQPGQLVIGTDSHTCTAGALGCFAFGVGSTDMANAWYTKDIQVKVPTSVRYNLIGKPKDDIAAKDIILYIMARDYIKSGQAIGKVLEFGGSGLQYLNMDERATLTNMAVEAGATTGIVHSDAVTAHYLMDMRGMSEKDAIAGFVDSDPDANYDAIFDIQLNAIPPMVATPGDPRNGIPIGELEDVKIDIAYGGSCTGGKKTDMDMYAKVLKEALGRGMKIDPKIYFYIQFGSQKIKAYAREQGYLDIFQQVGAKTIEPSCGACIKAGPGVSNDTKQVSISAINRNFPGRSGPGQVYLASPKIVAASALAGKIVTPGILFSKPTLKPQTFEVTDAKTSDSFSDRGDIPQ